MRVQLTPDETASLLDEVRNLGFEQLESYTDPCYPDDSGGLECLVGGGNTTLRLLLPSGTFHEVHFSEIAEEHIENLRAIRLFLVNYRHLNAEVYQP